MKGTITVSAREIQRSKVLDQVLQGALSLKHASELLEISYRQAKRLKHRYVQQGLEGLVHRGRGQAPPNRLAPDLCRQVLELHDQRYADFNDCHFTQMLLEQEHLQISREKIRQLLRRAGKKAKRRRRPPQHRSRRPRQPRPGVMVQWDGSPHHWFGPERPPCCLMAVVDDADSRLLAALFVPHEGAIGYLRLLDQLLRRHGVPLSIYHDRHSSLFRSDDHWSLEEQLQGVRFPTHVGRVLQELGIRTIPAYSPQAKGRIERLFGTLQDRLIPELALHRITELAAGNAWLEQAFIDDFNRRFARQPQKAESAFRRLPTRDRYRLVAFAYEAGVANDNCVRLGDVMIDIPPGRSRHSYAQAKVLVRQHLDGAWSVWHRDQRIATHPGTELLEPIRTCKRRHPKDKTRSEFQVYINSRPAPLPEGTFLRGS